MKIGLDHGQLVTLHQDRWFAVGGPWGNDVLASLAGGTAAVEEARTRIAAGDAAEANASSGSPFVPQSMRHYSFWEAHMVNAGRQVVAFHATPDRDEDCTTNRTARRAGTGSIRRRPSP